jgi:hypothetical protein
MSAGLRGFLDSGGANVNAARPKLDQQKQYLNNMVQ